MLKRISCDKFIVDGVKRPPIEFHMGLNTIVGDENGSNSVGKSTLMMVIDFCFGGNDYIDKEKDTFEEIGEHTINFEFVFNGISYFFARKTDKEEKNTVYICNENYEPQSKITNDSFKDFLLQKYQITDCGDMTLRDLVSPYIRVYNRGNHNEYRPINAHVRQSDASGITYLLKMYHSFDEISSLKETFETTQDKKKYFETMKKYNSNNIATNITEKDMISKELEALKIELEKLNKENNTGTGDADVIQNRAKNALTKERRKLTRQREALLSKKNNMNFDDELDQKTYTRGYEKLELFFNNLNRKTLEEVDNFHKGVSKIMKKTAVENNLSIDSMINLIDTKINEIDNELKNYENTPIVSDAIINRQAYLISAIKTKTEALNNFDKYSTASTDFKEAKEKLENKVTTKTSAIDKQINDAMRAFNDTLRQNINPTNPELKGKKYPPEIHISDLTSYSFYTPKDSGTGTRYKGLCLLDLAILTQTSLPIFVHDSIIYTNIEDETRIDLLKLYEQCTNKQIIVGVENKMRCQETDNNGTITNIAENHAVIHLSKGSKALFGKQWGREEK